MGTRLRTIRLLLIGGYRCQLYNDGASYIAYLVPSGMPAGRYKIRLERKNLSAETPELVYILKGIWNPMSPPPIPTGWEGNPLETYGTCYSAEKGYLIGGLYGSPVWADAEYSLAHAGLNFISELDVRTGTWVKRYPPNPRYLISPHCFYFDNAVYVIGGEETTWGNDPHHRLQSMLRLDLNTLAWQELDLLPYPAQYSPISFEVNGEWHIGFGLDSPSRRECCGEPLPKKTILKIQPGT